MTPNEPTRPGCRTMAALLALLCGLAPTTPALATPPPAPAAAEQAIPPGQEALLEAALTPGADWPPGWHLDGAAITKSSILVKYRHTTGATAQVTLVHPEVQPALLKTKPFALVATAGQPALPEPVLQALGRSLEAMVGWRWQAAATLASAGAQPPAAPGDVGPGGTHLRKARAAAAAGREAEAVGHARAALAATADLAASDRLLVQLEVAWVLRQGGDPQAKDLFLQAYSAAASPSTPGGATRLFVLGSALLGLDRHAAFATLTAAEPRIDCGTLGHWVREFASTGQPAGLDALSSLVARRPLCTDAAVMLATTTSTLGLPAQGERLLRGLLPGAGKTDAALLQLVLVQLLRQRERCPEALATMAAIDIRALPQLEQRLSDISRLYIDCHDEAALARFRAQSDADPKDGVAAFLAGAVMHHQHLWRASEPYLQRSAAFMKDQPRQFLYQAMNAHHLGDQARAVALIARAGSMGASDPDVQYCRAVILGDSQPLQAMADLKSYQAATARSRDNNANKAELVANMLLDLEACKTARNVGECRKVEQGFREAKQAVPLAAGVLGVAGLAGFLLWRRRRRAGK